MQWKAIGDACLPIGEAWWCWELMLQPTPIRMLARMVLLTSHAQQRHGVSWPCGVSVACPDAQHSLTPFLPLAVLAGQWPSPPPTGHNGSGWHCTVSAIFVFQHQSYGELPLTSREEEGGRQEWSRGEEEGAGMSEHTWFVKKNVSEPQKERVGEKEAMQSPQCCCLGVNTPSSIDDLWWFMMMMIYWLFIVWNILYPVYSQPSLYLCHIRTFLHKCHFS